MDLKLYFLVVVLCFSLQGYNVTGSKRFDALKSLLFKNAGALIRLDSKSLQDLIRITTTNKQASLKKTVAFHVYPRKRLSGLRKDRGPVVFDTIMTNEGGGYSKKTGVFVCPVAGIYSITLDALASSSMWWLIKVNSRTVGAVLVHKVDNVWKQTSRTVVVKLEVGDRVYIFNHSSSEVHEFPYTGFSGILLS